MRSARTIAMLTCCFLFVFTIPALNAQIPQSPQPAPPVAVRDAQALSILNQAVSALGGATAIGGISDLSIAGQFTDELASPPDVKVSRTYIKGLDEVRLETDTSSGTSVTIYSQGQGFQIVQGERQIIRAHASAGRRLEFFPALCIAELLRGSQVSIQMGATAMLNGRSVYQIKAAHIFGGDPVSSALLTTAARVEIFIDQSTLLPVGLRYYAHPETETRIDFPVDILFSDYRATNGVLMPYSAVQSFNGQIIARFTINSIIANQDLLDSQFQ